jgi:ADP-heptose:LPS heptosyltransferase
VKRLNEDDLARIRKILVIQLGPFGDALLTTSYFETLKKRLPDAGLTFLVKEPYDSALRGHPFIDRVMIIRKREGLGYAAERLRVIRAMRRENFDLVIDQQNKPSSQQLTLLSGAGYRLGYADARFSWAYNLKAGRGPLRYSAGRKYDILGPLGIDEERYRIYFHISEEAQAHIDAWLREADLDAARLVSISPGSPVRKKRWSPAGFAQLADMIQAETRNRVVLLWGPGETGDLETVKAAMQTRPIVAPPTDPARAAALMKRCRLLVCNDGGLNHLSVATGTPSIAIFGTTDPVVWSPASVFEGHYHIYKPGFDSLHDDTFGISPDEVFEKVKEVLSQKVRPT